MYNIGRSTQWVRVGPDYTPGIEKIVPRNVNIINKRLTISEWPTKILTTPS